MPTVRRRVLRQPRPQPAPDPHRQQQINQRRTCLAETRASLDRWMSRLRRAFHAVERLQLKASSLERQIRKLEQA